MRYLIAFLLMVSLPVQGQALWRNFFTTNQNPRVTVAAGSNTTVQASTVGVDQRIFTVNSVPPTNVAYATFATNASNATNFWGVLSTTNIPSLAYISNNAGFGTNTTLYGDQYRTNYISLSSAGVSNFGYFYHNAPSPANSNASPMYYFKVGFTNTHPANGAETTNFVNSGFTVDAWDLGGTNTGIYSYPFNVYMNGSSMFRISKHGNIYLDSGGGLGSGTYLASGMRFYFANNASIRGHSSAAVYDGITFTSLILGNSSTTSNPMTVTGNEAGGSNGVGYGLTLGGGRSTGSAVPGYVQIATGLIGSNGSTANGLSTRYRPGETVSTLTESTATTIATIGCNTNNYIGGTLIYTIRAKDASEHQVLSGLATFSAINTNGVYTANIADNLATLAATSGTLTATWSMVGNTTTNIAIKCNAVSSLTQTNLICKWQLQINSDDYATVNAF